MTAVADPKSAAEPVMLDVKAVARMLGCSPRHIDRLVKARAMPQPVRLGVLVKWDKRKLENWFAAGCPAIRID